MDSADYHYAKYLREKLTIKKIPEPKEAPPPNRIDLCLQWNKPKTNEYLTLACVLCDKSTISNTAVMTWYNNEYGVDVCVECAYGFFKPDNEAFKKQCAKYEEAHNKGLHCSRSQPSYKFKHTFQQLGMWQNIETKVYLWPAPHVPLNMWNFGWEAQLPMPRLSQSVERK